MPEPAYTLLGTGRPCPVFPQHRMVNRGRDESLYGDRLECACGLWRLANTDEHRARMAPAREATS